MPAHRNRRALQAERAKSRRKKGPARKRAQAQRVGVSHRKVLERRKDLLRQVSHRLTTEADVLKVETLNVRGMVWNHHLAISVADAGMSPLVTVCEHEADWRGRKVEKIDRWFPGSQTCCLCDARNRGMWGLAVQTMRCACGNIMGRDRNAAANHHNYLPKGIEERPGARLATRVETGDQGFAPVLVGETRS